MLAQTTEKEKKGERSGSLYPFILSSFFVSPHQPQPTKGSNMCNVSTVIRLTIAIINAMLVSVLVGAIIDDDYKALFVAMVWNFIVSVAILIPAETDKKRK